KAQVGISDVDRGVYLDRAVTLARHPSENDERMMVRLLAYALHVPAEDDAGTLEFGRGVSDAEEPDLWRKNLRGEIEHWIDLGEPDERRVTKALGRSGRVSILGYRNAFAGWWDAHGDALSKHARLDVRSIDTNGARALGTLAERSMALTFTIQEGTAWVAGGSENLELPIRTYFAGT
ncbi:MAG: YaeQ family protein, partial [Myxococcales bacterium]|nr:YaeQ family protein [Myxococcales bacterium]